MSGEYHWRTDRKLKILKNTDVLVVGAGLGGICAALSAAKAGCSVVLVEKNAVLGGQAAEIDTWGMDGFISREGHLVVGGYPWELLWKTVKEGASDPMFERISIRTMEEKGIQAALEEIGLTSYVPYIDTGTFMNPFNDQYVNPNAYRYVAQRELDLAGVHTFLGMPAVDVLQDNNRITGVVLLGEFEKFAVLAKRVVDTTQGASVCAMAGKNLHILKLI